MMVRPPGRVVRLRVEVDLVDAPAALVHEVPANLEVIILAGEDRVDRGLRRRPWVALRLDRGLDASRDREPGEAGSPSAISARAMASASSMPRPSSRAIRARAFPRPSGLRPRIQVGSGGGFGIGGSAFFVIAGTRLVAGLLRLRRVVHARRSGPVLARVFDAVGQRRGDRTLATRRLDSLLRRTKRRERPAHERQPELVRLGRSRRSPTSRTAARSGIGRPSSPSGRRRGGGAGPAWVSCCHARSIPASASGLPCRARS